MGTKVSIFAIPSLLCIVPGDTVIDCMTGRQCTCSSISRIGNKSCYYILISRPVISHNMLSV